MIRASILLIPFLLALTVPAVAEESRTVAYLGSTTPENFPDRIAAFRAGLREEGYVEGKNLAIEYRWAKGRREQLLPLASEIAAASVDVIFAPTSAAAIAAKKATSEVPIVFASVGDPIRRGLVASLARPGGRVTGIGLMTPEVNDKRLELLKEMVPNLRRVYALRNPKSTAHDQQIQQLLRAGKVLGIEIIPAEVERKEDLEATFSWMEQQGAGGLLVLISPFSHRQLDDIADITRRYRVPATMEFREFAETGGLMSYGPSLADNYRRAGMYVAKILKGAAPNELPVEQPTQFELIINLAVAKELGIAVPPSILLRAHAVVQ